VTSLELEIEKIVAGGDGLARHEGRVVFVPKTAPSERHVVDIVQERKDYLRGRSSACLEASPSRRQAPCRYDERCGGCALMHLTPEAQLAAKKSILLESLTRSGAYAHGLLGEPKSDDALDVHVTPSPELGYRTRLRFHISRTRDGTLLGFRRRGSHVVEDVEACKLASDELNQCWRRLRGHLQAHRGLSRSLESVELQESSDEPGRITARFLVRSRDGLRRFDRRAREALLREAALEGLVAVSGDREVSVGQPFVHHRVAGFAFRQSVGAFFQTNRFLVDKLVASVSPSAPVSRVVDLYCGVGLFAIPLASTCPDVIGVEASPVAVRDAVYNAQVAGASARFVCEDAARFAAGFRFEAGDYVVVDPPRGGLPRPLRETLVGGPLREIGYVSCDPAAFGRDAAFLAQHGFRVRRLELFDLFPNTHHFETVASFTRTALDSAPRQGQY
jgi:23S rRNA (uracil1939-C5)-methyltransferase